MKKTFLCSVFLLCSAACVFAQKMSVGIVDGYNFSKTNYYKTHLPINSTTIGASVIFYFNKKWSFKTGLISETRGWESSTQRHHQEALNTIPESNSSTDF